MKEPAVISLFTEKAQTDIVEIIRAIFIVIVLAWVGWIIAGTFGLQESIIEIAKIVLVVFSIGAAVFFGYWIYSWRREKLMREKRAEELRRTEAERRAFEDEQRKKGLVKFVDRFGKEKWGTPKQVKRWKKIDDEAREKESLWYKVVQEIKGFKPARKLRDEYVYENSLYSWLKKTFPRVNVQVQRGSSRPDIAIDNIAIEIKGPTRSRRQLDSIPSKCMRYHEHFEKIIVVLFDVTVSKSYYDEWFKALRKTFPGIEVIRKD